MMYCRHTPRVIGGAQGGGRFLMGEVPLYPGEDHVQDGVRSRHGELGDRAVHSNSPRPNRTVRSSPRPHLRASRQAGLEGGVRGLRLQNLRPRPCEDRV